MTSEGLVEMFEGDFADKCADNLLMGGQAEGVACTDSGITSGLLLLVFTIIL